MAIPIQNIPYSVYFSRIDIADWKAESGELRVAAGLDNQTARQLADHLGQYRRRINLLELAHMNIDLSAAPTLSDALYGYPLTTLILNDVNLSSVGVDWFVHLPYLTVLEWKGGLHMSRLDMEHFFSQMPTSLTKLSISPGNVTYCSIAPLMADMLTACRQLVTFQLERVPLTSSDIQLVCTHLLDQNTNLTKLVLNYIALTSADLAVLAPNLPPSLLHLDLRDNHLDDSSVGLISDLAANSHFVKLRVERQNWSSKVHGGLGRAMKTNTFLHKFTHRTTVPKRLCNDDKWCRFNRKRNMTLEDWCLGKPLKTSKPNSKFVVSFTGRPLKQWKKRCGPGLRSH